MVAAAREPPTTGYALGTNTRVFWQFLRGPDICCLISSDVPFGDIPLPGQPPPISGGRLLRLQGHALRDGRHGEKPRTRSATGVPSPIW